jgi:uncharacterized protein (DUF779 family)
MGMLVMLPYYRSYGAFCFWKHLRLIIPIYCMRGRLQWQENNCGNKSYFHKKSCPCEAAFLLGCAYQL